MILLKCDSYYDRYGKSICFSYVSFVFQRSMLPMLLGQNILHMEWNEMHTNKVKFLTMVNMEISRTIFALLYGTLDRTLGCACARKKYLFNIQDYDLRLNEWNIPTLHMLGTSEWVGAILKYMTDITSILDIRWIGQGGK